MNTKAYALIAFSVVALSATVFAFLSNASPYVTVAQAQASKADNLHVAGDIDKTTLQVSNTVRECTFMITDESGDSLKIHSTDVPANMGEATKVVAIGGMDGEIFKARKLLLKCPSKYESEKEATQTARR